MSSERGIFRLVSHSLKGQKYFLRKLGPFWSELFYFPSIKYLEACFVSNIGSGPISERLHERYNRSDIVPDLSVATSTIMAGSLKRKDKLRIRWFQSSKVEDVRGLSFLPGE
jgi:hypothetical protein